MVIQSWVDVIVGSLQNLWAQVLGFLPALVGALVIFIVGLIVASILEKVVERVIFYLKLDTLLRKAGVEAYFQRANVRLDVGFFFGKLVYWFMIIAFLLAASDILGFFALSSFLKDVLAYIPSVLVAALIVLASLVAANFLRKLIIATMQGAKMGYAKGIGTLVWWVVFVFGILTALLQVGVAVQIINTLVTGLIAMLALAGGLAFGLGSKDRAGRFVEHISESIRNH